MKLQTFYQYKAPICSYKNKYAVSLNRNIFILHKSTINKIKINLQCFVNTYNTLFEILSTYIILFNTSMIRDDMINIFERQHYESRIFSIAIKIQCTNLFTYLNKENKGEIKKIK